MFVTILHTVCHIVDIHTQRCAHAPTRTPTHLTHTHTHAVDHTDNFNDILTFLQSDLYDYHSQSFKLAKDKLASHRPETYSKEKLRFKIHRVHNVTGSKGLRQGVELLSGFLFHDEEKIS